MIKAGFNSSSLLGSGKTLAFLLPAFCNMSPACKQLDGRSLAGYLGVYLEHFLLLCMFQGYKQAGSAIRLKRFHNLYSQIPCRPQCSHRWSWSAGIVWHLCKRRHSGRAEIGSQYLRCPTRELALQTEAQEPVACCCLLFQLDRAWLPLRHWQLPGRALCWLQSGLSLIDSVSKCLVVAVC